MSDETCDACEWVLIHCLCHAAPVEDSSRCGDRVQDPHGNWFVCQREKGHADHSPVVDTPYSYWRVRAEKAEARVEELEARLIHASCSDLG